MKRYRIAAIGCSLGGADALKIVLAGLPADFDLSLVLVQHRSRDVGDSKVATRFAAFCALPVLPLEDKEPILPGRVYLAPSDYHVFVEDGTFALSVDERVQFSRPSIDVLFVSLAAEYGRSAIGVLLTGGNRDGAVGLAEIARRGGYTIVQDPRTARMASMPAAALSEGHVDSVLGLEEIGPMLVKLEAEKEEVWIPSPS